MTVAYHTVHGRDAIMAAAAGQPFVSCFATADSEGLAGDSAVVWIRNFHFRGEHRKLLLAYGDAAQGAELCAMVASRLRPSRITVPSRIYSLLGPWLRPERVDRWRWFYTRSAPDPQAAEHRVGWIPEGRLDDATRLLETAFPDASNWPDQRSEHRRWFGVRDESDRLIACGLCINDFGMGPFLSSIAVHPDTRGQGLGSAMTAWVTRRLLAEGNPMVALGSYITEHAVHRLYRRLGFVDTDILASGRLTG